MYYLRFHLKDNDRTDSVTLHSQPHPCILSIFRTTYKFVIYIHYIPV